MGVFHGRRASGTGSVIDLRGAAAMTPAMRKAELGKLIELEGIEDENALFASAISDGVCPAICHLLQFG